jgi:NitT/TauT family transport system ATP-binding protein
VTARGALAIAGVDLAFPLRGGGTMPVLDGIDLLVPAGGIVALIGPNGSGKSTLLRVVAGLLAPVRGTVTIDGVPVVGPSPRVGLAFQEPRLLPWRTARENVGYPLELAGIAGPERGARVEALLRTVGLEDAGGLIPSRMSGGMRQRAALARTLATDPQVLLLDEPFSALDELTRERLNLELLEIADRSGATVIIVTHSVHEAIFLADRVVVLSERPGRVVADIPVRLPRPRSLVDLDAAVVGETASASRAHLAAGAPAEAAA